MFIRYLVFFSFFLVLGSCSKYTAEKNSSQPIMFVQKQVPEVAVLKYVYLTDEDRARLFDIPFVIDSKPWYIQSPDAQDRFIIQYTSSLSISDIVAFYSANMQGLGWQEIEKFISSQTCLTFQTPTRRCIIHMRTEKRERIVTLFVSSTGIITY